MPIEVKVPVLSESVSDATLAQWHKKVGDSVMRDENLVDLETDKVVLEVVAPHDGVLSEIKKGDGELVASNEVIAVIDETAQSVVGEPASTPTELSPDASAAGDYSPAVRKLIADHQLEPEKISGTGKGGRITKEDVLKYIAETAQNKPPEIPTPPAPVAKAAPVAALPDAAAGRGEERVPMTRLRARIAQRLVEAQHTAAMLTSFNEINMQPVMDLRAKYRDRFEKRHDIRLGFMSFFIKACVEALKAFPVVNASVDGDDILYHNYFDVGVAVSTDRGLVVPIVRDADRRSFAELEHAVVDFAKKARDGKLAIEDLSGGTFSITNGGVFGSLLSTPILNPPQSAILGMHKIEKRPVVENDEIVIRPMMYVALTYDHRIIDGREAVSFLVKVKEFLEDPARIMLQI